jgi:citrate lyase subunit beta/citryl-CoA lyase
VSPKFKDETRILVRNALRAVEFKDSERMVRINQLPLGLKDLEEIVPYGVHLILVPKVEDANQLEIIDRKIDEILKTIDSEQKKDSGEIFLMPIIESAKGILNANSISGASKRNVALAIGLEDYTADIGAERTKQGTESFFARQMIVNAAKANGLLAIDTVYSDVSDMEGLRDSVLEAKSLGFDGKGCIHPRQIRVVHQAFSPTDKELEKAKRIVFAADKAAKEGLGVVSLGSKMIDPPVIKRAERVISIALKEKMIEEDWRNSYEG